MRFDASHADGIKRLCQAHSSKNALNNACSCLLAMPGRKTDVQSVTESWSGITMCSSTFEIQHGLFQVAFYLNPAIA
jgi:hypothetical protein